MRVTRNIKYDCKKRNSMSSTNQSIPVLVAGALGRMGSEVIKAINSSKDCQLVAAIDSQKDKEGQDIGSLLGLGGALSMMGVALTPSDLMYNPHIFFNMWIFRFFLLSTICYSWLMYKHNGINNYYLIGNLIFIIFLLTYVLILIYGPSPRESDFALIFQVTAQKIILFNFILSILVQTVAYSKIIHSK